MRDTSKKINTIYNLIILDESGSMHGLEKMSVDGVNETIQTIKSAAEANPEQKQMFSFLTFSGMRPNERPYRVHTLLSEISQVKEISLNDYQPRGNTPLWDTMGIALRTLEKEVGEDAIALVTVITDGYENASREYTGKMIKDLVSRLDEKGWVFTYIGANQDVEAVAATIAITNVMQFTTTSKGTKEMSRRVSSARERLFDNIADCCFNAVEANENFFNED
jgi:Mg-chelatase subunit ChlD